MRLLTTALVLAVVLSVITAVASAAEGPAIPKKALDAMEFFVGKWEGQGTEDGKKLEGELDERKWAPGKHCITMNSKAVEGGVPLRYFGVTGWDAKGKQLVEHWYGSNGMYVIIRYPLAKMKEDIWKGNARVTYGDGTTYKATCQLNKTNAGYRWRSTWEEEGKQMVRESIARRVK